MSITILVAAVPSNAAQRYQYEVLSHTSKSTFFAVFALVAICALWWFRRR
jgi:hypothetical protein